MTAVSLKEGAGAAWNRSIAKKQIVALTGGLLVLFILFHLAGNLLILLGPEVFNAYAGKLESLGPLLWVARIGLITIFVTHIWMTIVVTLENRRARGHEYQAFEPKANLNWATKYMIHTGLLLVLFLILHIIDFPLADRHGEAGTVAAAAGSQNLELYGVAWNRFTNPLRDVFYILAVTALGMHLSHGFQSVFQSVGSDHNQFGGLLNKIGIGLGVVVAVGFSAIPIFVIIRNNTLGVGL